MALGSLGLSLILAAILPWIGRSASTVPYIVEVDPKGGARAVGPAVESYRPSDAQIAFHLARFVDNVRSLSSDPVVVRQNWLKAYDFVTDKAAVTLNEYAREHDPFTKVGRESVSVEVSSVVRASDSTFQVAGSSGRSRVARSRTPGGSRASSRSSSRHPAPWRPSARTPSASTCIPSTGRKT